MEYSSVEFSPQQFAGHALAYFCLEDHRFNNFVPAIEATLHCLEKTTGRRRTQAVLKELRSLLNNDPSVDDLIGWATHAFPSAEET